MMASGYVPSHCSQPIPVPSHELEEVEPGINAPWGSFLLCHVNPGLTNSWKIKDPGSFPRSSHDCQTLEGP